MNDAGWVEETGDPVLDAALVSYAAAVEVIAAHDLTGLVRLDGPSSGLHAVARVVEAGRRRLTGFDCAYVNAMEVGAEPARYGCSSSAVFLREQLRISTGEARRRVLVAAATNGRCGFSGEPLPARLPLLAEAIAAGQLSGDQAAVVVKAMDALPARLPEAQTTACEEQLIAAAQVADPGRLAAFGLAVAERADPDGALRDYDHAHAVRGLTLHAHQARAGGRITGEVDVELLEKAQTVLEALSAPVPAGPDGLPDQRTAPERTHDALKTVFDLVLAGGQLPASGGTPTTVVFHINATDATDAADATDSADGQSRRRPDRTAMATTEHGHRIPVPDALAIADHAAIYQLVTDTRDVPLTLRRAARIATPGQSIALAARDRGCSFPGCDRPPAWCQRHHVIPWLAQGETNLDNLTLLCGYHHREFAKRGWTVVMIDGCPWWVPPRWLDPAQQPIRNHAHHHDSPW